MIKVRGLSKRFTDVFVLDNLSAEIKDNTIYGLVGANGAGKSTLLRIINSVYDADAGKVLVDGKEIVDDISLKQDMVFVPDDLFFYNGYTLMDTAKYYQSLYEKFDMNYLLDLAGLLKLETNKKINTFSKGMKRQCAIICALATNAKYMFFDETFDGLDPVVRNLIKRIVAKQMEDNKMTVVMTSHNLRELEDICDNLGLLYKGGILFESDIDSLKTDMCKVQISLKGEFGKKNFDALDILSFKKNGSVATIVIRDKKKKSKEILESMNPVILDFIPLTLEEVFIYEMEAIGYEFKELV